MTNRQDTERAGYDPSVNAPPSPAPEKASLFEDFIDVFYAPGSVFARRQNRSFWPYFWIVSVVFALFLFASRALMSAIFDAEFTRNMRRAMEQNPQMTPEMMEQGRKFAEMAASFGMYLTMPLLILIGALLLFVGAKIVKANVSFGDSMLIASIAQIPRLVSGLLTAIQGLLMDPTTIQGAHQVSYGPMRFMDPDTVSPGVMQLLGRFDLFTLWVTVLMGIGVAVIGKVPRSAGFIAAGIAWLLGSLTAIWGAVRG